MMRLDVRSVTLIGLTLLFALLAGCERFGEVASPEPANVLPETSISGQRPVPLEASSLVDLAWSGSDQDGQITGYQWKLCSIGCDGISEQDTMTVDKDHGVVLHPWHFTTARDSTLVLPLSVDPPGVVPCDAYAFLVRAIDDRGGIDSTPAIINFTPRNLLPSVSVDRPSGWHGYMDARPAPPTVMIGFTGIDPDHELQRPVRFRYLFKTGWVENPPHYVSTRYEFDQRVDELASFEDPEWSEWLPYATDPEQRVLTFVNLPQYDSEGRLITYFLVLQAIDADWGMSIDRIYGSNVQNFYISQNFGPQLTVFELYLGTHVGVGLNNVHAYDIASDQPLNFSWIASAEQYGGTIAAYRYGWDVIDPDDENDPGWAVAPGISPEHLMAPERTFDSGVHTLTIQVWDNIDQLTRMTFVLDVVPVPDPSAQRPLLLVDDVMDRTSNAWPAQDGMTPLDRDEYRDAFWEETLAGSGGVMGFDWGQDVVDTEVDALQYRDLVQYRSVLWTTRFVVGNFIWENFKPFPTGQQPYIWLSSYQATVGNLFMAGSRAMNEFIEEANWMIPWVFDTDEMWLEMGGQTYRVGFGERELPDGSIQRVGLERYPYASMGIAVLDQATPRYNVYGRTGPGSSGQAARNSACVGVKGLLLDPDFKSAYMPAGGVFPDTLLAETTIDWQDLDPAHYNDLQAWPWGNDEFYDGNITDRSTPWAPQDCDGQNCVEPMFRIYSRLDWVDDLHAEAGDPDWPLNVFTPEQLESRCGRHALDPGTMRSKTGGQILGLISHKLEQNKPSQRGDVMWGFDPYRFEHGDIRPAIHWVLGEHFGLTMQP